MNMILHLQRVVSKYKEVLSGLKDINLTFNEASILYSIDEGINTKKAIITYLQKDRSQIHRQLARMVKDNLIEVRGEEYLLTSKGSLAYSKVRSLNVKFDKKNMKVLSEHIVKLDNLLMSIKN
ncbi:hypothetical protein PM10SUCC1_02290 [Propionigenium maris DSM 9537]|uniref:Uncharacterized protein n=1 Tax=Propionigenium maris DSM 9537 TaxID=1123000 RepID=A0A9W6GG96_9FUSO|nr:helix-turn-helix domain-containing protein [Propionigenium maris]GLI54714.1 hypothetical protein PM10SUCC1_02290 [Propionigenium maris DSM 9537]